MEVPSLFQKPVVHQVCMGDNDELVPNLEDHLLCDEVIDDWDELDSYETRKSFVNQHESKPAYDDSCKDSSPPPNSPVSFKFATQFSFVEEYFNPYIYDLLHIWRESCKDYDSSGESTEVLPSDSQNSDVLSQGSQYSTGYAEEDTVLPISTQMESYHAEVTTDEQDKIYVNQDSSLKRDEQDKYHQRRDTGTNSTFISENYDHVLVRDNDVDTPAGPANRIINSAIPVNSTIPEEQQQGEGTEEENDSGEDNLSSLGSPEPMLEETADGIVYRLQEILIFEDERYPSPVSLYMTSSDHQVPDMEMEIDGYFSDETSGGFNHRRSRTLNSCIDQVVPGDMLEE